MAASLTRISFRLHSPVIPPQRLPFLSNPSPLLHLHNQRRKSIWWSGRPYPLHVTQAIKLVESYDGSFQLEPQSEEALRVLLSSELFCNQASQQSECEGSSFEFTGELFKPVPWSATTKHGMPQEFEKYLDRDKYAIINVPPNFMFKAKIFSPSRLCAVFRRVSNLSTGDS
ncbi:uncharacterized protein LOC131031074 isoform X1 [Cryptomeria japonica]|uniref:uncharacterized protein LOC131031074 isoform X1 n=1 Tax=Cryptomeria japonica TaxID=3369 RepID=UPI0025AD7B54|nr:uncharacterized protein LOC131031074 isoform X1 [Cryptomeria japonica]